MHLYENCTPVQIFFKEFDSMCSTARWLLLKKTILRTYFFENIAEQVILKESCEDYSFQKLNRNYIETTQKYRNYTEIEIQKLSRNIQKYIETIQKYRNYKDFNENIFCHELDQTLLKCEIYKSEDPYSKLTEIFQEILQKHAPLKSKQVRGNHAPFINKELSKVIMNKSRLRNKYPKWPSRENFLAYKKVKNKCNTLTLTRKTKKRKNTSNTLPKIRTLQRARHSGIQLLQIKVQYQMKT